MHRQLDCAAHCPPPRVVPAAPTGPSIGIFDSGVGGLSILAAIRRQLPAAPLRYVADSAHAPYGEQSDAEIRDRASRISDHLIAAGAKVIVIACNTATAAAIDSLRAEHPGIAFVGVEPGVRPAVAVTRTGHVGVLATEATLRSERFASLAARESAGCHLHLQACTGLAAAIEHGQLDDPALHGLLERYAGALRRLDVDVVALGCTHYSFVRGDIERVLGAGVTVIDTGEAVAAQVARVWRHGGERRQELPCLLETTGDPEQLLRFARTWLEGVDLQVAAQRLTV